jgi:hypothetical protein
MVADACRIANDCEKPYSMECRRIGRVDGDWVEQWKIKHAQMGTVGAFWGNRTMAAMPSTQQMCVVCEYGMRVLPLGK